MADTFKESNNIVLIAAFADEDDRSISMPNPKSTLNESEIRALEPLAAKVIIGDKYQAAFTRFKAAKNVSTYTTDYDLT